jgi:hypothetical protein
MQFLAEHPTFDGQLDELAQGRPQGMPRSVWDAQMERDVRQSLAMFTLAKERLPWPILSAHVALLMDEGEAAPPHVRLRRTGSFARVLRAGRVLASGRMAAVEERAGPVSNELVDVLAHEASPECADSSSVSEDGSL